VTPARAKASVRANAPARTKAPAPAVRTVFIGSGGFGIPTLRTLAADRAVKLVGVVTAPARPSGRKLTSASTPVADAAADLGIVPVLTPERLRAPAAISEILALKPGLIVLADYGQIVPAELLGTKRGALNLHPSLLPRHRGATPVPATIVAGDETTGVTLMRMDEGLDTGPLVAQVSTPVAPDETAPLLESRLAILAADLLSRSLGGWLSGELEAQPQPRSGATVTRPLRRDDGRLDPGLPASELERQVRAYQPWPGSFVDTVNGRLIVRSAGVGPSEHTGIGRLGPRGLATADGTLIFHEVQPAGGRPMPWIEYLRGRPRIVGSTALASAHGS
jgi:methionyl-tRNA formyltransferase